MKSKKPSLKSPPSHALRNQLAIPERKLAYTMAETARLLGVGYITVHRLLKQGLLKSSSALRTKIIPHSEIERFLRDTTTQAVKPSR